MKPGRPSRHIKAKWIAWCKNGESTYYELDEKGNLIKSSDSDFIHETFRNDSKSDKKKRNKQKNDVRNAESDSGKVQDRIERDENNKVADGLNNKPYQNFIRDNSTLDFFDILDQLNDENTLFDQLFEF